MHLRIWLLVGLLALGIGCQHVEQSRPAAAAAESQFHTNKLAEMDEVIATAIERGQLPGGVLWLQRQQEVYAKAYGNKAKVPAAEPMSVDTIFDAASLTKVIATAPAVLRLMEKGLVRLDDPVSKYLPEFREGGKDKITLRHLLTHTSGLRAGLPGAGNWQGVPAARKLLAAEAPTNPPDQSFRYSDINYIALGLVVETVSGKRLNEFCDAEIFRPLGMKDTRFLPPARETQRIAPTEVLNGKPLRGVVHDPTSRRMGGVAGHAGLFTTAADLSRFARMLLGKGTLDGKRVFASESVALMIASQSPNKMAVRRGIGWDIDSPYSGPRGEVYPMNSFGHTGWTGTSIWIDPSSESFIIFLSNRNHPDEKGSVLELRWKLGTLAAQALRNANFPERTGSQFARVRETLNGIDVLTRNNFAPLKKKKIGLITNHTGIDRQRRSTIDLLHGAREVELKALFSPEHGIRGELDEKIDDGRDEKTGLPVYSLYGVRRSPAPEQLVGLDALVFDIQDIGCRFYTYIATMGLAMEAASKAGIQFIVLDRVNPINGVAVEGPLHTGASSFTAFHKTPLRHGMTVGELARMFKAERGLSNLNLLVVPVENWTRNMWFDETGLPWINPSPNMRSLAQATLYPGVGLHETPLSVGRGTDTPFEIAGAPYIEDTVVCREMRRYRLPGVSFVPVRFTPKASTFKDQPCGGINLIVTDRNKFNSAETGLILGHVLQRLYPGKYTLTKFNTLLVDRSALEAVEKSEDLGQTLARWRGDSEAFKKRRQPYLLY